MAQVGTTPNEVAGKVAIVTGGASGIGRALPGVGTRQLHGGSIVMADGGMSVAIN